MPSSYQILIWLSYFAFNWLSLRMVFTKTGRSKRFLIAPLVIAQFFLKLFDRYLLPSYFVRAADEKVWLEAVQDYQNSGAIGAIGSLSQGPGIFYAASLTGDLIHVDYSSALVFLAIFLGSLYVLPAFFMYERFAADEKDVALTSVLLLSVSDVMIYSTTVARPTLFGLFLIPVAIAALQLLYVRFHLPSFLGLLLVSLLILLFHAPVSYVVLLLALSFSLLAYDRVTKWLSAYALVSFTLYGLTLTMLPDLDRIWRKELFGAYPLNIIPSALGGYFFVIFPLIGVGIVGLSRVVGAASQRISQMSILWRLNLNGRATSLIIGAVTALAILGGVLVFRAYSNYITNAYGDLGAFLLLHGWKLPFGILAVLGIRTHLRTRLHNSGSRHSIAFSWLLSLLIAVLFLAWYPPVRRYGGLGNLDERFAEFAYYPSFYFIALGLLSISKRSSSRMFKWVVLPMISLFSIPSIIVGTRDPDFIKQVDVSITP